MLRLTSNTSFNQNLILTEYRAFNLNRIDAQFFYFFVGHFATSLINPLACKSVSAAPERTLWTRFAVWIVDALLVRTSDNAINHGDGNDIVVLDKALISDSISGTDRRSLMSEYHRRNFGSAPSWLMIPMTSLLAR